MSGTMCILVNVFYLTIYLSVVYIICLPAIHPTRRYLEQHFGRTFLGHSISVGFRGGQGNCSYLTHLSSLKNLFLNVTLHEIWTCTTDKDGTPSSEGGWRQGQGMAQPSFYSIFPLLSLICMNSHLGTTMVASERWIFGGVVFHVWNWTNRVWWGRSFPPTESLFVCSSCHVLNTPSEARLSDGTGT